MKTPDSGSSELAKQNPGGILRKSPKASLEDDFKMPLEGTDVLVNEYCVIQKDPSFPMEDAVTTAKLVVKEVADEALTPAQRKALEEATESISRQVTRVLNDTFTPDLRDSLVGAAGALATVYSLLERDLGSVAERSKDDIVTVADTVAEVAREAASTITREAKDVALKSLSSEDTKKLLNAAKGVMDLVDDTVRRVEAQKQPFEHVVEVVGSQANRAKETLRKSAKGIEEAGEVVRHTLQKEGPGNLAEDLLAAVAGAAVSGYQRVKHGVEHMVEDEETARDAAKVRIQGEQFARKAVQKVETAVKDVADKLGKIAVVTNEDEQNFSSNSKASTKYPNPNRDRGGLVSNTWAEVTARQDEKEDREEAYRSTLPLTAPPLSSPKPTPITKAYSAQDITGNVSENSNVIANGNSNGSGLGRSRRAFNAAAALEGQAMNDSIAKDNDRLVQQYYHANRNGTSGGRLGNMKGVLASAVDIDNGQGPRVASSNVRDLLTSARHANDDNLEGDRVRDPDHVPYSPPANEKGKKKGLFSAIDLNPLHWFRKGDEKDHDISTHSRESDPYSFDATRHAISAGRGNTTQQPTSSTLASAVEPVDDIPSAEGGYFSGTTTPVLEKFAAAVSSPEATALRARGEQALHKVRDELRTSPAVGWVYRSVDQAGKETPQKLSRTQEAEREWAEWQDVLRSGVAPDFYPAYKDVEKNLVERIRIAREEEAKERQYTNTSTQKFTSSPRHVMASGIDEGHLKAEADRKVGPFLRSLNKAADTDYEVLDSNIREGDPELEKKSTSRGTLASAVDHVFENKDKKKEKDGGAILHKLNEAADLDERLLDSNLRQREKEKNQRHVVASATEPPLPQYTEGKKHKLIDSLNKAADLDERLLDSNLRVREKEEDVEGLGRVIVEERGIAPKKVGAPCDFISSKTKPDSAKTYTSKGGWRAVEDRVEESLDRAVDRNPLHSFTGKHINEGVFHRKDSREWEGQTELGPEAKAREDAERAAKKFEGAYRDLRGIGSPAGSSMTLASATDAPMGAMKKFANVISDTVHSITGDKHKEEEYKEKNVSTVVPPEVKVKVISNPERYNFYAVRSSGMMHPIPCQDELTHRVAPKSLPVSSRPVVAETKGSQTVFANVEPCELHHSVHPDAVLPIPAPLAAAVATGNAPPSALKTAVLASAADPFPLQSPRGQQREQGMGQKGALSPAPIASTPAKPISTGTYTTSTTRSSHTPAPAPRTVVALEKKVHEWTQNPDLHRLGKKILTEAGTSNTIASTPIVPQTGNELYLNAPGNSTRLPLLFPSNQINTIEAELINAIPEELVVHSHDVVPAKALLDSNSTKDKTKKTEIGTNQKDEAKHGQWREKLREKAKEARDSLHLTHSTQQQKVNPSSQSSQSSQSGRSIYAPAPSIHNPRPLPPSTGETFRISSNPTQLASAEDKTCGDKPTGPLRPVYAIDKPGSDPRPVVLRTVDPVTKEIVMRPLMVASSVDTVGNAFISGANITLDQNSGFTTDSSDGEDIRKAARERYEEDVTDLEDDIEYERRFLLGSETDS